MACPEQVNLNEVDHISFVKFFGCHWRSNSAEITLPIGVMALRFVVSAQLVPAAEDDFVSKVATKDTGRERQNTRASFRDSEKYSPVPSGCDSEGVGLVDKVELRGRALELEFLPGGQSITIRCSSHRHNLHTCKNSFVVPGFPIVLGRAP